MTRQKMIIIYIDIYIYTGPFIVIKLENDPCSLDVHLTEDIGYLISKGFIRRGVYPS